MNNQESISALKNIGHILDQDLGVSVYNSGIVKPSDAPVISPKMGKVKSNAQSRPRRSETWEREWPATRQRQTNRSRAPGKAPSIISSTLRHAYESQIDEIQNAYPGTKAWKQAEGMWLVVESSVLPGLEKQAIFLLAIPYNLGQPVKAWGFWRSAISMEWIGPRHTNYGEGSICAFDPADGTWLPGDDLVSLIDLYTLWALRHEHLSVFGRWPGHQHVAFPFERLTEFNDDEFCGCENSGTLYKDCCKSRDLALNFAQEYVSHWMNVSGMRLRVPPGSIIKFVWELDNPPLIKSLFI